MDFNFATPEEISRELGARIRQERLAQGLTQAELAARAGIARGALMHLEKDGASTVPTLVKVVQALRLESMLQNLFVREIHSIAELEQVQAVRRQRVRRSSQGRNE
jgi:transcriptional regulator with XRE-family HTH domain